MSSEWLLYGATGFTGRLIAREAANRGLRPIVAGRDKQAIESAAAELDCPSRVFALDGPAAIARHLKGNKLVLNCAGPFSQTAPKLIAACLTARCHYLDITGEIDVIESTLAHDADARAADVSILPAVGFDVVPSDCLAALLKDALPTATHLTLAIAGGGELSRGTAKTSLEALAVGGRARVAGQIVRVAAHGPTRVIPFSQGPREAQRAPWGDVASAYHTTDIPNIETYLALSKRETSRLRILQRLGPLLRVKAIRKLLGWVIERTTHGPNERELAEGQAFVWGEVRDDAGATRTAELVTPNPYRLTALSALGAVERVLNGGVSPGCHTPTRALGREFALSLNGVRRL